MEAKLDDPEVASLLLAQTAAKDPPPRRPALSEFDTHAALLTDLVDRLGEAVQALYALGGNKPPRLNPAPRPVTGVERARALVAKQRHLELVDEVRAAQERWAATRPGGSPQP